MFGSMLSGNTPSGFRDFICINAFVSLIYAQKNVDRHNIETNDF